MGTFLSQNLTSYMQNMPHSTYVTYAMEKMTLESPLLDLQIGGHHSTHDLEGRSFLKNTLDSLQLFWKYPTYSRNVTLNLSHFR